MFPNWQANNNSQQFNITIKYYLDITGEHCTADIMITSL